MGLPSNTNRKAQEAEVEPDEEVNYVLLSGPQGGPHKYHSGHATEAGLHKAIESAEERGLFCYAYALEHPHYSTSDDELDEAVHAEAQRRVLGAVNGTDSPAEQERLVALAEQSASAVNNAGHAAQRRYLAGGE